MKGKGMGIGVALVSIVLSINDYLILNLCWGFN